jgi:benzil reductase ((S)-benzoin forming)
LQKIALITGTGGGIGKALSKLLLKKGFKVFGYSRTNQIENKNFTFIKTDLSNLEEVQKIKFPETDSSVSVMLVNNAATIGEIVPLDKKSETGIIDEYSLNIITPTIFCKKFIQSYKMVKKLIINIGSGAANKATASWSTYCATKSGMDMLTEVISKEKHKNLTSFSIHPGVVDTKMQYEIRNSDKRYFPLLDKFIAYYNDGELENIQDTAKKIYYIVQNKSKFPDNIVSLRDVKIK